MDPARLNQLRATLQANSKRSSDTWYRYLFRESHRSEFPPELRLCARRVFSVRLSACNIPEVPAWSGECTRLRELWIEGGSIQNLPPQLARCTRLDTLGILNCQLRSVPEVVLQLRRLKVLNLTGNQIEDVPEGIAQLKRLTHIILRGNQVHRLPPGLLRVRVFGLVGNTEKLPRKSAVATLLNARERQHARMVRCPKCNYDRTGLAAGAVCPECGNLPA